MAKGPAIRQGLFRYRHGANMDATDKAILNRIQSNFPICPRPYKAIADELNLTETEVIRRTQNLTSGGIIRRIGANFVPGKLGYVSTLCAATVPPDKIDLFTSVVNSFPGVTHNYLRENKFNIWFTFIAPSMADIEQHIEIIKQKTEILKIINLPATHVFKIRAKFNL